MMADRGITFSAAMVRALLEGRKSQTRRLIPKNRTSDLLFGSGFTDGYIMDPGNAEWRAQAVPHQPGDRLYVREHWKVDAYYDPFAPSELTELDIFDGTVCYLATAPAESLRDPVWGRHRQAMHMPRWASRLTLLVTDVRVQRLQEISGSDCIAEGIEADPHYLGLWKRGPLKGDQNTATVTGFPKLAFRSIWEALHTDPGTRWEDNPFIYAVTFEVRHGNIDRIGGEA